MADVADPPLTSAAEHDKQMLDAFAGSLSNRNTRERYTYDVAAFQAWCRAGGHDPLRASRSTITTYMGHLAGQGARPATVRGMLISLSAFYRHLQHDASSPVRGNPVQTIRRPDPEPRALAPLDIAQVHAFLDAAATNERNHLIACLILQYGLTPHTVCALNLDEVSIDLHGRTVLSCRRKGGVLSTAPLAGRTAQAFDAYLAVRGRHHAAGRGEPNPLLLGDRGGRLRRQVLARLLGDVAEHLELDRRSLPRRLTDTFLTLGRLANVSAESIEAHSDHSTERVDRYLHQVTEHPGPAIDAYVNDGGLQQRLQARDAA